MNNRRWLHPDLVDRQAAEKRLLDNGADGSFLVRRSKTSKGDFSLSVRRKNKIIHVQIKCEEDGFTIENGETFASLNELIDSYVSGFEVLREKNGANIELKRPLNYSDPTRERWYHGHISRDEAEKMLLENDDLNAFLVRESSSKPGEYVITVRVDVHEVTNILVVFANGEYCVPGHGTYPAFETITELVDHYRDNPLSTTNRQMLRLGKPVNTTRINIAHMDEHLKLMKRDEGGFATEFEWLDRVHCQNKPFKEGRKAENIAKNRYKNILPYDETRIRLCDCDPDIPGSDYINANLLQMNQHLIPADEGSVYIATQGCLSNTIDDFWRMIWQKECNVIVMLTKLVEKSKNKCFKYWPDSHEDPKIFYLPYNVQLTIEGVSKRKAGTEYEVNELQLTRRRMEEDEQASIETRTVYHYHFLSWPDKAVPKDPGPLLEFIKDIDNTRNILKSCSPCVVHCSAGIGRTGAFIVIDALLRQINIQGLDCDVDVLKCVEEARQQRSGMVQTKEQYEFIHKVIHHYFETQQARHKNSNTEQEYSNLYGIKQELQKAASLPVDGRPPNGESLYENSPAANAARDDMFAGNRQPAPQRPVYGNTNGRLAVN